MSSVLIAEMGTPAAAAYPATPVPRLAFGGRHLAVIFGFAVFVPLVGYLFAAAAGESVRLPFLVYEFAACLAIGGAAQLSALMAQNRLRHRMSTPWRVALAVAVAALGATALLQLVDLVVARPLGIEQLMAQEGKAFASFAHRIAYQVSGALKWSLVLVVLCELLEANRRAQDQLHAVRMAALAAERDLVEGKLRAMQARVDPDLLFDTLLEIDRCYAHDGETGRERLDALIRFLRAALPSDGGGGSSVGREQELVEAYVELVRARAGRGLMVDFATEPAARQAPMPAMLLLPLVRWALADGRAQRARVDISRPAGALAVVVESDADGTGALGDRAIGPLRERLGRLFPAGADLRLHAADGMRRAALTIPAPPQAV